MKPISASGLGRVVGRIVRSTTKTVWIMIAAVLIAVTKFVSWGDIETAKAFCDRMLIDLISVQPMNLSFRYVERFMACDPVVLPPIFDKLPPTDDTNCDASRFGLLRPISIFWRLWRDVWSELSWVGDIILLLALVVAAMCAIVLAAFLHTLVRAKGDIGAAMYFALPIVPVAFAITLVVLKVLAVGLFWLAGSVLGFLLWASIFSSIIYGTYAYAKQVMDTSAKMDKLAKNLSSKPPPAKPDSA